jgi:hypothetical protein
MFCSRPIVGLAAISIFEQELLLRQPQLLNPVLQPAMMKMIRKNITRSCSSAADLFCCKYEIIAMKSLLVSMQDVMQAPFFTIAHAGRRLAAAAGEHESTDR